MITLTIMKKTEMLKTRMGIFKIMGGNIPGGSLIDGNFPPGGNFLGGSFLDTVLALK